MTQNKDNPEVILLSDPTEQLNHPFYNKQIVFTGALSTMTRSEAAKKVLALGGILQGVVTKETDFVILGNKRRGVSTKHLMAKRLISLGFDIQIIPEDDFNWILSMSYKTTSKEDF